ncbi:ABC transporter ATP-binding protein [Patescibacteria group bacterium]|nr:ABC transporter ATP-binding protein [Patescibacteria group bacterium]MCL5409596.1 ABC transporter ATP-binding protein [Patescibacteria group bacterium]
MILRATHVSKVYHLDGEEVKALDDISLSIDKGEFVSIIGPSGSGKSTLMHIIGLLDSPSSGEVLLEGQDVTKLSEKSLAKLRNQHIGFVFQQFNLLPRTSALENVELPMYYGGVDAQERQQKAIEMLNLVGLSERMDHWPNQLSGGQQQRVAIARSLVMNPAIVLADEPTGNLDSKTGQEILRLFHQLHDQGHTIVLVTHDGNIAAQAKRQIRISDGKIEK